MSKLGNLSVNVGHARIRIGFLDYNVRTTHVMLALMPDAVIPVLRDSTEVKIRAICYPYENIESPPFIEAVLQICLPKNKRMNVGYIFSSQTAEGQTYYTVVLEKNEILKRLEIQWIHCHEEKETADVGVKENET